MSQPIIKVENLSKSYVLNHEGQERYTALRDVVANKAKKIFSFPSTNKQINKSTKEEFWALKDVSFEINQGDRVGIIGRNGAGKSTLLKILSRITEPTQGRISIKGRVASLLEVGTGFHPELSGRENIYLNGAILGMSRAEIRRKFDEIVDFAEVEKFLDTPVKRYSSGMYVRLAFAVAAHLEPEVLIVDEVLAVGDAQFQKKCLGKMEDVSKNEGRTVLFVSHNLAAVKQFCNRGIVLTNGKKAFGGTIVEAVNIYQSSSIGSSTFNHSGHLEAAPGNEKIRITRFDVKPLRGEMLSVSSGISFELEFFNANNGINMDATFELKTLDELAIFHHGVLLSTNKDSKQGSYVVGGEVPPFLLNAGTYKFKIIFGEDQRYPLLIMDDLVQFEILNESLGSNSSVLPGILRLDIPYKVSFKSDFECSIQ